MLDTQGKLSIDNVMFATDFSPATANAFSYALAIANRYGSKLHVAHVINMESFELVEEESARRMIQLGREEAVRRINQLLEPMKLPPGRYDIAVSEGDVVEALQDLILKRHIDIAVLGTHGRRGLRKLMMGSVAEEIFRVAPCPVLTAGLTAARPPAGGLKHILYPVHFAPDNSNAPAYAVSLAERYGADLTVMNVRDASPDTGDIGADFSEPVEHWIETHIPPGSDLRKRFRFTVGYGPAADAILDFAVKSGVDLIVLAVRRLDPIIAAHLPKADTAYALATQAACPLLTVGGE
jgi:nucleotide-binding universal stress UspA family protein